MSESSKASVRDRLRKFSVRKFRGNIQELSSAINVMIKGWIHFYCMFHKWTRVGLWFWLNRKLTVWKMAQKRRLGKRKAIRWLESVYRGTPNLLAHWQRVPATLGKNRRPDFGSVRRGGEIITHAAVRGLGWNFPQLLDSLIKNARTKKIQNWSQSEGILG